MGINGVYEELKRKPRAKHGKQQSSTKKLEKEKVHEKEKEGQKRGNNVWYGYRRIVRVLGFTLIEEVLGLIAAFLVYTFGQTPISCGFFILPSHSSRAPVILLDRLNSKFSYPK